MNSQSSTYFQDQTEKEKTSKLLQLASSKNDITIWCKGDTSRVKFNVNEFSKDRNELIVQTKSAAGLVDKEVLYSFKLSGLNFFGKGKLKALNGKFYVLQATETLYKSERRNTFRLLTYPHQQVYIKLPIPEEEVEKSNVVSFNTKMSETNLFKNFLSLMDEKTKGKYRKGYFPFRVLDLSVTGLAFQTGELESEFFPSDKKIEEIFIDFNGREIAIPKCEIVYNVSILHSNTQQRTKKIGVRFLDIDTNLDEDLGKIINGALRDVESDFEDFI